MKIMVKSEELEAEMEDDEGIDHRSSTLTNTPSPNGSEHSGSMLEDGRMVSHLMNKNECRFCHQIFDNQTQLSIHYTQSHSERRHYSCSECRAVFAVKRELATHFRIHQGATPHTCEECGKEFGTRQLLKKHCMWHSGERSHVCPHCNKAFFQKGHLTQHLMIHAGGRPHVCSLCNKTFIFKFDLNRHMKIHAERGFSCQHCGKAFARHKQLQEHLLVKCKANPNSAPSTPSSSQHSERRSSMISLPISIPSSTSSIAPSTPSSLLQSVPVSLSNLPQLVTPRPILPTFQNLSFGNLSVEDLHRVAQSLLTQHRPVPQPDPLPQMCLLCAQPFPSQEALFLHMSKHFTANPQLFNNALIGKQEVKPDTLRTPLSVMASLPNAMEQDEVNTPSITDSATSSSCPNSPQKTSPIEVHPSRSPSPITTTGIEERLKIKCCEECVRQRARTEELEGEVERQREMIRNTRHLLDQMWNKFVSKLKKIFRKGGDDRHQERDEPALARVDQSLRDGERTKPRPQRFRPKPPQPVQLDKTVTRTSAKAERTIKTPSPVEAAPANVNPYPNPYKSQKSIKTAKTMKSTTIDDALPRAVNRSQKKSDREGRKEGNSMKSIGTFFDEVSRRAKKTFRFKSKTISQSRLARWTQKVEERRRRRQETPVTRSLRAYEEVFPDAITASARRSSIDDDNGSTKP
ncbi:unnamed protein product, partial [Mesorhabditis belari]|uniref:C2H2-type domain-containing protein n=1 Tax=Mesorhabditis belari TaxID=2138241 RepID=A0AAF3FEW2_9BILA